MKLEVEIDHTLPRSLAYYVLRVGADVKILKNPALCAGMPTWLQETALNTVLRRALGPGPRYQAAWRDNVIHLDQLEAWRNYLITSNAVAATGND